MHIQVQKKGFLIIPILVLSSVMVIVVYSIADHFMKFPESKFADKVLGGVTFMIAGIINYFVAKDYYINSAGEREYYDEGGTFMYIKVTLWTRIFFGLGIVTTVAAIADAYNL